jgi:hypothetical protein
LAEHDAKRATIGLPAMSASCGSLLTRRPLSEVPQWLESAAKNWSCGLVVGTLAQLASSAAVAATMVLIVWC